MKQEITDIITRVLAGESTAEDELQLLEWLGENQENQHHFAECEKTWNTVNTVLNRKKFDSVSAFAQFRETVRKNKIRSVRPAGFLNIASRTLKLAAIGLILITAGSLGTYYFVRQMNITETAIVEVKAPAGSRSNVTLTDGTTVWLNAGSKLTYSNDYGSNGRTVCLEGEGFFNVEKDSKNPFTVVTSQLEIVALGTSFNVKSYPDESIIQTTLVSGSLQVTRSEFKAVEKGVVLEPNQQITYYKGSDRLLLTHEKDGDTEKIDDNLQSERQAQNPVPPRIVMNRGVDPEVFTAWKDNRLIFDDEPFESIAIKLERRFGARIIIEDDEIKNKKFKGRFDEITIEQALSALKFASPFEFYIKQDTIFISSIK